MFNDKPRTFCLTVACTLIAILCGVNLALGATFRRAASFEDAYGASCRVSVPGARGSGTFVGCNDDGTEAYIITNHHVVTDNRAATLDFWTNGKRQSISGRVDWRFYDANIPADFARIVVDANELKKIDPPYVALGGSDAKPSIGAYIVSSGAPDGRFTQAWKGQVLEYYNGKTCVFSPPPVPGQSGSAICEFVDGELFMTGVLTWLLGEKGRDESKGGAIPIENLYLALRKRPAPASFETESPIPPNASECASVYPKALTFIKDNCPACARHKQDFNRLETEGVETLVNVSKKENVALARRYGIRKVPVAVIVLGDREVARVTYDEMEADGAYMAIHSALKQSENGVSFYPPEPYQTGEDALLLGTISEPAGPYESDDASDKSEAQDFRARTPVRESLEDSNFFDNSDRVWRNRRRDRETPSPQENEDDTIESEPIEDEPAPRRGWVPGDRALGSFADKLGAHVDKSISKASDKIAGGVSSGFNNMANAVTGGMADVCQDAKQSVADFWRSIKTFLFYAVVSAVVVGLLIGKGIAAVIGWVATSVKRALDYAVDRAAEAEMEPNANLPKNGINKGKKK